jgi:hypothetical protein
LYSIGFHILVACTHFSLCVHFPVCRKLPDEHAILYRGLHGVALTEVSGLYRQGKDVVWCQVIAQEVALHA